MTSDVGLCFKDTDPESSSDGELDGLVIQQSSAMVVDDPDL